MAFLAKDLRHRIEIQKATEIPNDFGMIDMTYETLITCWAGLEQESEYVKAIRGMSTTEGDTHQFTIRKVAVEELGKAFSTGFSTAFDIIADINMLKGDFFIFLQEGSSTKGRKFRVNSIRIDNNHSEWVMIQTEELFEEGTGAPE